MAKAKPKRKRSRAPVARKSQVAAKQSEWDRLERSRREVFSDFCKEHGVAPEKLEHVYRDTVQDWLAAANKVLAPEGRHIFFADPPRPASAAGDLRLRLFIDGLRDPESKERLTAHWQRAGIAEHDYEAAAAWLIRQFADRGWEPEKTAATPLADLVALLDKPATVRFVGKGRYQIGDETIVLDGPEASTLESLVRLRAATKCQLVNDTGYAHVVDNLKAIRQKYPLLAPHIVFPGGKGRGGYRTTIVDDRSPK